MKEMPDWEEIVSLEKKFEFLTETKTFLELLSQLANKIKVSKRSVDRKKKERHSEEKRMEERNKE
jgi:hypothetical protein